MRWETTGAALWGSNKYPPALPEDIYYLVLRLYIMNLKNDFYCHYGP